MEPSITGQPLWATLPRRALSPDTPPSLSDSRVRIRVSASEWRPWRAWSASWTGSRGPARSLAITVVPRAPCQRFGRRSPPSLSSEDRCSFPQNLIFYRLIHGIATDLFVLFWSSDVDAGAVRDQSSGKSSVLESIVGRDFLPRGSGKGARIFILLYFFFFF